jgi:chitinase
MLLLVYLPVHCRTYDYSTFTYNVSSHNSNWHPSTNNPDSTPLNSNQAIVDYVKAGIAPSKIVVGMPLYGRTFANTDGPGQNFHGTRIGIWEPSVYDYKDLPLPGATTYTDDTIAAAWSYDSAQRFMVSYDTLDTIAQKSIFIKAEGLGGAMWWESSGDKQR